MSSNELIDYLTMLSWNALCGIVEVGGVAGEVPANDTPVAGFAATIAQTMSKSEDLPEPWTHEPHDFLVYRDGNKVADVETSATPGFGGKKADAAKVQPERNARFAELQEMLYANSKGAGDNKSLLLVLQGMDTSGKGGGSATSYRCRSIRRSS